MRQSQEEISQKKQEIETLTREMEAYQKQAAKGTHMNENQGGAARGGVRREKKMRSARQRIDDARRSEKEQAD